MEVRMSRRRWRNNEQEQEIEVLDAAQEAITAADGTLAEVQQAASAVLPPRMPTRPCPVQQIRPRTPASSPQETSSPTPGTSHQLPAPMHSPVRQTADGSAPTRPARANTSLAGLQQQSAGATGANTIATPDNAGERMNNPKKRPRWERVDQTKARGRPMKVPQYILHSGDTSSDSDDNVSLGTGNQDDAQRVESSDDVFETGSEVGSLYSYDGNEQQITRSGNENETGHNSDTNDNEGQHEVNDVIELNEILDTEYGIIVPE